MYFVSAVHLLGWWVGEVSIPHTYTTEAKAQLESNELIGALSSLKLDFIYHAYVGMRTYWK